MSEEPTLFLPAVSVPRHVFCDPVFVPENAALDRHPQTERACSVCGCIKVTVHAPNGSGWREWRQTASGAQFIAPEGLPCVSISIGAKR